MAKPPCTKFQYVVTPQGPKILPFDEPSCKDEESPADYNAGGYLPVKVNDTFNQGRYRVVRKLGWGHFSTVWLVKDSKTSVHSALKVVKSAGRYAETARDEIKLLSRVASVSPSHPGRSHIVSFLDSFSHQGPESSHICIVFEPLGENLLAMIERNKKRGVPRALVKVIAKQILLGLQYLHDECDLVHTDIKPENILISIPDIEEHINQELSQSPSPTSRRVGVPLPTKSRAGVTIPYNQQRARRQVQIFESQPLSSPGRSLARSLGRSSNGGYSSLLVSPRAPGSGNTSQSNSYVTQMNILRNSSSGLPPSTSFIGGSPAGSNSIPKAHSNLCASFPVHHPKSPSGTTGKVDPSHPSDTKTPSTSSSSSSISSGAVSTPAGGSIISTPPTSLSQSMTSSGFLNKAELQQVEELTSASRNGIPIQLKPGKGRDALGDGCSLSKSASWVGQAPCSLPSSHKGSPFKSSKPRSSRHGHSHSQSGMASAPWQDPGIASPAPVVLVNAVVGADGQDSGLVSAPTLHPSSSSTSTITISHSASESSSTAATITQPSPTGTPLGLRKSKTMSIINGVSKLISDTSSMFTGGLHPTNEAPSADDSEGATASNPISLLTQTAPTRINTIAASPPARSSISRPSPPQHTSYLSAHMHAGPCHSLNSSSDLASTQPPTSSRRSSRPNLNAIPMPRHDVSPAPPPPTPIDGPPLGSFSTHEPTLPPISTSNPNVAKPPPISIKIADLGNASPSKKHFTEDIQTRQYRAPEAIVGRKDWDTRADIWSVACLVFELLTAEYLFDPQGQGELFTKDDDHMAQIIELLGDFALEVKMGGKYSRELFDHTGGLRYIKTLKPWPLRRVMTEKYLYTDEAAETLTSFLLPMLKTDMRERAHARDMLDHPWLDVSNEEEVTEW